MTSSGFGALGANVEMNIAVAVSDRRDWILDRLEAYGDAQVL